MVVRLVVRFPQLAAWIVCLVLLAAVTLEVTAGVVLGGPAEARRAEHVHGVVVAVQPNGDFALHIGGQEGTLWFHLAAGSAISLAHLRRHLVEHAETDVVYCVDAGGALQAWSA